jgi:hypothetical protein
MGIGKKGFKGERKEKKEYKDIKKDNGLSCKVCFK